MIINPIAMIRKKGAIPLVSSRLSSDIVEGILRFTLSIVPRE